jgi:ABC-type cobalamin/Fe3+-siderophores transport system ATPase subunit
VQIQKQNVQISVRDACVTLSGSMLVKCVNVDAHVDNITVLMGQNGSGKTTLLRTMAGEHTFNGQEYKNNDD